MIMFVFIWLGMAKQDGCFKTITSEELTFLFLP